VQFKDGAGRIYQPTSNRTQEVRTARGQSFVYTQDAFVTPGDYRLTCRLPTAQEHNIAQRTLHVAPKNDPLPGLAGSAASRVPF
jgi:hypothetical protein